MNEQGAKQRSRALIAIVSALALSASSAAEANANSILSEKKEPRLNREHHHVMIAEDDEVLGVAKENEQETSEGKRRKRSIRDGEDHVVNRRSSLGDGLIEPPKPPKLGSDDTSFAVDLRTIGDDARARDDLETEKKLDRYFDFDGSSSSSSASASDSDSASGSTASGSTASGSRSTTAASTAAIPTTRTTKIASAEELRAKNAEKASSSSKDDLDAYFGKSSSTSTKDL